MVNCSIVVGVGSFLDPPNRQGLAHFLEHMIFMGSEQINDENAFGQHIAENGGYCNAYTENEFTNYYFKIKYEAFQEALRIQAYLLAAPLLKEDAQQREIQAVD